MIPERIIFVSRGITVYERVWAVKSGMRTIILVYILIFTQQTGRQQMRDRTIASNSYTALHLQHFVLKVLPV